MVNPGAFRGARKDFLISEKAAYAAGVDGEYAADALALIQRRYFRRFPIELPDNEQPSTEDLAAINDSAPDPERDGPDESLGEEDYAAALQRIQERGKQIEFRKAQIKRWLSYQYMKDHDLDPKESGANNPYRVLLYQLTGISTTKPRMKTAVNIWCKTQTAAIDREVKKRAFSESITRKTLAAFRARVVRELYAELPDVERKGWETQAREDHDAQVKKWKEDLDAPPSTAPADRQKCILGLVRHTQPIIDAIAEATGWKVSLLAGGPEPAAEGRLNMISVHSGTTGGDVKVNFGRAERVRYKKFIVPIFGSFLRSCYTANECHERALPVEEGYDSLGPLDVEGVGANFDSVGPALEPWPSQMDTIPASPSTQITMCQSPTNSADDNMTHPPPRPEDEGTQTVRTPPRQSHASPARRSISHSVSRSIERALNSEAHSPAYGGSPPLSPAKSPPPPASHSALPPSQSSLMPSLHSLPLTRSPLVPPPHASAPAHSLPAVNVLASLSSGSTELATDHALIGSHSRPT